LVISSLVISSEPAEYESVCSSVEKIPGTEIVEKQNSKMAVVLETASTEEAVAVTSEVRTLPGVISVELISHFFEDEVSQQKKI